MSTGLEDEYTQEDIDVSDYSQMSDGYEQPGYSNDNSDQVKKLSLRTTMFVLMGLCVVAIIVIFVFRGIRIEKSQNSVQVQEHTQQGATIEAEGTSSGTEISSKNDEIAPVSEVPDSSGTGKVNTSELKNVQDIEIQDSEEDVESPPRIENDVQKVAVPDLSEPLVASAMVSSKSVYRIDGSSYAYCINIMLLVAEDDYRDVKYFCPKKTYDGVSEGDTLLVEYQTDNKEAISVSTISKQ